MGEGAQVTIRPDSPPLDRVLTVAPLVVVGTVDDDGVPDLAPKHMVMPVGDDHLAFTCSPTHTTHRNLLRSAAFTVSWLRPDDVLLASLAAGPRSVDGEKATLAGVATSPATVVDGVVLTDAPLVVECELERVLDDYGHWSVVVGRIVHAVAATDALLSSDEDPHDVLRRSPLLAYVHPDHVATIDHADAFPYHRGFRR